MTDKIKKGFAKTPMRSIKDSILIIGVTDALIIGESEKKKRKTVENYLFFRRNNIEEKKNLQEIL